MLIESGGDNLAATFSPELADLTVYVIDVAAGDKIPSKGGPGITRSDLLVINKIDLAPYVGASLDVMERDAMRMRGARPFVFSNLRTGQGVADIVSFIEQGRIGSVGSGSSPAETQHFGQQLAIVGSREELDPTYGPPPALPLYIKYASTSARWADTVLVDVCSSMIAGPSSRMPGCKAAAMED